MGGRKEGKKEGGLGGTHYVLFLLLMMGEMESAMGGDVRGDL